MDEYLQNMKTLRSQMNDVEDQAAKISVEEEMHVSTIHTLESDILSAKSEMKRFKEDTDKMMMAKGQILSQILAKQRKIASLETDSHTLSQTLELIQHEISNLSAKLIAKRTYYANVTEDLNAKLHEQQEWINANKITGELREQPLLEGSEVIKNLMAKLNRAEVKLNEITLTKSKLVTENTEMKQCVEQLKRKENGFKEELRAMDIETLEQEHNALLSDKTGESEFLQSLQAQIEKLKEISHVVKCGCGNEYKVGVNIARMNIG